MRKVGNGKREEQGKKVGKKKTQMRKGELVISNGRRNKGNEANEG